MSKRAWMPLYVGDYLGDTGHLSTSQHGAYLLLMMHYWRKGELPDDDKQLAAITKLPLRIWQDTRETLQAFFYDGWKHKRIDTELARMERVSVKRSEAGRNGGLKSALGRATLEWRNGKQTSSKTKQLLEPMRVSEPSNCSDFAQAGLDHSHSQRKITTASLVEGQEGTGNGKPEKPPPYQASAELVANLNRKH